MSEHRIEKDGALSSSSRRLAHSSAIVLRGKLRDSV